MLCFAAGPFETSWEGEPPCEPSADAGSGGASPSPQSRRSLSRVQYNDGEEEERAAAKHANGAGMESSDGAEGRSGTVDEPISGQAVSEKHPASSFASLRPVVKSSSVDGADAPRLGERASVSLTMIVRDEEENLARCLGSVRGLFDEIVVVDTGSVDRTKEIAREFGARVFDFVWIDDFAAARNEALAHATGDYAFWLDADDVVEPDEKEKLRALLDGLAVSVARSAASAARTEPRPPGDPLRHSGRASLRASRVPMPARTEPRPPGEIRPRVGHARAARGRSLALPGPARRLMSCGVRARQGLMGRGAGPLSIMSGSFRFGRVCAGRIGFTSRSCRR